MFEISRWKKKIMKEKLYEKTWEKKIMKEYLFAYLSLLTTSPSSSSSL